MLQLRLHVQTLFREKQSAKIDITTYLQEYGPVRDTIGLYARTKNFTLPELRKSLISESIYYGRFLGGRLVFMHKDHVNTFQIIARYNLDLTPLMQLILELIHAYPGISISKMRGYINESVARLQEAVNNLESQLYISRTSWNPLVNYTARGYMLLPHLEASETDYNNSVKDAIQLVLKWFGLLSLN
ncbi:MAG: hypothetical protein ACXAC2_20570, partial [Candidatus Kariarchaeaceae archaeon]